MFRKGKALGEQGFFERAVKVLEDLKSKSPEGTLDVSGLWQPPAYIGLLPIYQTPPPPMLRLQDSESSTMSANGFISRR